MFNDGNSIEISLKTFFKHFKLRKRLNFLWKMQEKMPFKCYALIVILRLCNAKLSNSMQKEDEKGGNFI